MKKYQKFIQHSDRVEFKKMIQEKLAWGWNIVSINGSSMKSEDWFCAVLEKQESSESETRLARISKIVSEKKRVNLTNADFDEIKKLSGT